MIISITHEGNCAAGGHTDAAIAFDAGAKHHFPGLHTDILLRPLTRDDYYTLFELLLRAKLGGMTRAQARTAMIAGISVTV